MRKNRKVVGVCPVCNKLLTYGPHKHRYQYCKICKKETVHIIPFFGFPWHCRERHPLDDKVCAVCLEAMPDEFGVECIGKSAVKRICDKCSTLNKVDGFQIMPVSASFGEKPIVIYFRGKLEKMTRGYSPKNCGAVFPFWCIDKIDENKNSLQLRPTRFKKDKEFLHLEFGKCMLVLRKRVILKIEKTAI